MIEIAETTSTRGFTSDVFFERTEKIRERVVDCTREELVDLVFHQLSMLEKIQARTEKMNDDLEKHLGYHERM